MAQKAVVDAVKARLGSLWNGLPVETPNEAEETSADGSPFIALQFPVANVARMPVNQGVYREEGGFRIVLNGIRGAGIETILVQAEQIAALFRDQSFSGVSTLVPSSPFFDDSNENGNYFKASIVVPYTYTFT